MPALDFLSATIQKVFRLQNVRAKAVMGILSQEKQKAVEKNSMDAQIILNAHLFRILSLLMFIALSAAGFLLKNTTRKTVHIKAA